MSVSTDGNGSAMSRAPWMQFWGDDFMSSTLGWSACERGAYLILLWAAWQGDGLPADPERVFRIDPDIRAAWPLLESKFPVGPDGRRRNARQESERVKAEKFLRDKAAAGRASAAARQQNGNSRTTPVATDAPTESQQEGNHSLSLSLSLSPSLPQSHNSISINGSAVEPDSSVNDPKPNRRATIPQAALDALWLKFPRKVGRKKAMALLDKGVREIMEDIEHDEPTDALIYMGERIDALAHKHRTTDPKFIPHPATWLGQGRYLDPEEIA